MEAQQTTAGARGFTSILARAADTSCVDRKEIFVIHPSPVIGLEQSQTFDQNHLKSKIYIYMIFFLSRKLVAKNKAGGGDERGVIFLLKISNVAVNLFHKFLWSQQVSGTPKFPCSAPTAADSCK